MSIRLVFAVLSGSMLFAGCASTPSASPEPAPAPKAEASVFEPFIQHSVPAPKGSRIPAQAGSLSYDGCYQLFMPGAMYPAFCLSGTAEEGIGGAGARMVIFHTNTDRVIACSSSSSLAEYGNTFEFIIAGRKELILRTLTFDPAIKMGDAVFGKTTLKYMQLDAATTKRLMAKWQTEPKCQGLQPGQIVNLSK